jgi:phosphatidate cytidylyltransferase
MQASEVLRQRTLTAVLLAPAAILLILLAPTWLFALAIAGAVLAGLWEWSRLAGFRNHAWRSLLLALMAALCLGLWFWRGTPTGRVVIALGVIAWLLALLWLRDPTRYAAPSGAHAWTKLAFALPALLPAWLALVVLHDGGMRAHVWTLLALMLVWAADTGAYFAGTRYGRHKLAPLISPGKTREGVAGGALLALVVAAVFGYALGLRGADLLLLLGVVVVSTAFSIIGDLSESLLKRQAAVKDSGRMFPGHGGLLDRIDGVLAAAPAFVLLKLWLGL